MLSSLSLLPTLSSSSASLLRSNLTAAAAAAACCCCCNTCWYHSKPRDLHRVSSKMWVVNCVKLLTCWVVTCVVWHLSGEKWLTCWVVKCVKLLTSFDIIIEGKVPPGSTSDPRMRNGWRESASNSRFLMLLWDSSNFTHKLKLLSTRRSTLVLGGEYNRTLVSTLLAQLALC